jgi:uncharacterized membrane protein YgdD (TMEM256/DUF423 family)
MRCRTRFSERPGRCPCAVKRDALILCAALSAALAIGAGAFGAHMFGGREAELLRTGGMYQLVHAVATVALYPRRQAWVLLAGAAVFAVSLYALALGAPRFAGAITPVGGAMMIVGWLWLAWRGR